MLAALTNHLARHSLQLGSLSARRVIWGLVLVFSLWILLDVFVLRFTGGLTRSSFDAMVRGRVHAAPPDPRIVIVDIDEASLLRMAPEFGRWPWPRDTLAAVLDHIEKQAPAAVVWDIVFSDADRISPGGDAAFDAAARRSKHSVFSVVRLPAAFDAQSALNRAALPALWTPATTAANPGTPSANSTLALIAPALPAVAAARLGYNNGYVDADGVLRRYRYFETLPDASAVHSVAMATLALVDPAAYGRALQRVPALGEEHDALIAWRAATPSYPHIAFADVFAQSDGAQPMGHVPSFAGKVVVIGSTAASLHDIHATPLSPTQPGVESLATALDNALNERHIAELPRWLQATLAIALCIGLALWVQSKKIASLTPMTFVVPAGLIFVSYVSLNGAPVFIDLHLSAALALLFLALLRYWNRVRRGYWCHVADRLESDMVLWPLLRNEPWGEDPLDLLIDAIEAHAPTCRVVVPDVNALPLHPLRWPEFGWGAAILGPAEDVLRARTLLKSRIGKLAAASGKIHTLAAGASRQDIAAAAMQCWLAGENKQ